MSRRFGAALAGLALVVAACGGPAGASTPPEINYGRDICVECSMIISEERHAAAYRLPDGAEKVFDDIGGMVKHGREQGELDRAAAWVHDFQTAEWVEADQAFYVPTVAVTSPMGHGIFAFATRTAAEEFAAGVGGEVIGWEVVLTLPVVGGLVGHHHETTDGMDPGEDSDQHGAHTDDDMNNNKDMDNTDMEDSG